MASARCRPLVAAIERTSRPDGRPRARGPDPGWLRAHRGSPGRAPRSTPVPVPSRRHVEGWRRQSRLPRPPARRSSSRRRAAVHSGARSVPLWQMSTAQFQRAQSIDAVCRDTARRSAITSSSPTICSGTMASRSARAGDRADPARPAQAVGARAEPRRHGGPAARSCSRRGGRFAREFDVFFGLEAADRRRPDQG